MIPNARLTLARLSQPRLDMCGELYIGLCFKWGGIFPGNSIYGWRSRCFCVRWTKNRCYAKRSGRNIQLPVSWRWRRETMSFTDNNLKVLDVCGHLALASKKYMVGTICTHWRRLSIIKLNVRPAIRRKFNTIALKESNQIGLPGTWPCRWSSDSKRCFEIDLFWVKPNTL